MVQSQTQRPPLRVRKPRHDFDELPRHWMNGDPFATHMANGLHLLFPAGERFFVRSVRYYLHLFDDDPEMRRAILAFGGQEGAHSREHERAAQALEAQGYDAKAFMRLFQSVVFDRFEPLTPPKVRLAATAACEHYTALMADDGLRNEVLEEWAHPVMADLLRWHAVEEIEHKSVAYDVLQRVDDRWILRAVGMALATAVLAIFWALATHRFLSQDGYGPLEMVRGIRRMRSAQGGKSVARDVFLAGIREYLEPGFHPWNHDNRDLIRGVLAELEMPV